MTVVPTLSRWAHAQARLVAPLRSSGRHVLSQRHPLPGVQASIERWWFAVVEGELWPVVAFDNPATVPLEVHVDVDVSGDRWTTGGEVPAGCRGVVYAGPASARESGSLRMDVEVWELVDTWALDPVTVEGT